MKNLGPFVQPRVSLESEKSWLSIEPDVKSKILRSKDRICRHKIHENDENDQKSKKPDLEYVHTPNLRFIRLGTSILS